VIAGPIPGCKPCTNSEMTYCKDGSVIDDHCCCDSGYDSKWFSRYLLCKLRCNVLSLLLLLLLLLCVICYLNKILRFRWVAARSCKLLRFALRTLRYRNEQADRNRLSLRQWRKSHFPLSSFIRSWSDKSFYLGKNHLGPGEFVRERSAVTSALALCNTLLHGDLEQRQW